MINPNYHMCAFLHPCCWPTTMRRMVRSVHLALSQMHFTDQFDFTVSDRYTYQKIHTASLGTTRWTDLTTRHHIKPSPRLVLRLSHLAFLTMSMHIFSFFLLTLLTYFFIRQILLTVFSYFTPSEFVFADFEPLHRTILD